MLFLQDCVDQLFLCDIFLVSRARVFEVTVFMNLFLLQFDYLYISIDKNEHDHLEICTEE